MYLYVSYIKWKVTQCYSTTSLYLFPVSVFLPSKPLNIYFGNLYFLRWGIYVSPPGFPLNTRVSSEREVDQFVQRLCNEIKVRSFFLCLIFSMTPFLQGPKDWNVNKLLIILGPSGELVNGNTFHPFLPGLIVFTLSWGPLYFGPLGFFLHKLRPVTLRFHGVLTVNLQWLDTSMVREISLFEVVESPLYPSISVWHFFTGFRLRGWPTDPSELNQQLQYFNSSKSIFRIEGKKQKTKKRETKTFNWKCYDPGSRTSIITHHRPIREKEKSAPVKV